MKRIITVYLKPYYGRMAGGFTIKFLGSIMDLFIPWILSHIIDVVIPTGDRTLIYIWGGGMIL